MYSLESDRRFVSRRECLEMSLGAFAVLLTGCIHRTASSPDVPLTWDQFANDLVPQAKQVFARRMTEEAYVPSLARRIQGFHPTRVPPPNELHPKWEFTVTEYDLPAGDGFPYHDHRDYNGVLYVM